MVFWLLTSLDFLSKKCMVDFVKQKINLNLIDMEKKQVCLTKLLLYFEKYGSSLGMTRENSEIRDYVKSELLGLEKDLKLGNVEIIDLCECSLSDLRAFLAGYAFKQGFPDLVAEGSLYVHIGEGFSPVESRPRWEMNSLIALLEAKIKEMSPEELEVALSAREQAISDFARSLKFGL